MLPVVPTAFTLWASLFGGVLIGLSAVMVMLVFGRIAGIAGISTGALSPAIPGRDAAPDWGWRLAFLGGLVAAPVLYVLIAGPFEQAIPPSVPGMALAGLLVGLGTGVGSGCTSGHGVCGLARLSGRSLVAVITFMLFAAATVLVLRHVVGG
ncbi:YeeE/YedE family protein [Jannaschia sp. W003]|uniref:YeeE/YedE family protein n=1 Tax=Jannaschia sp. W003 TaxID=2867012 RepID=UPI0021A7227F|nr:YeeE/YedE family protein [Jannaschia sp. W003]UWQ22439.1 YeeE/YedE family protein [Jannaschia sp. W003]